VRGINRDYLHGPSAMALRPILTFWLNVTPQVAFAREFKKSHTISDWESGRDMSLSSDLFRSFIRYQSMIKREFEYLARRHQFVELNGEQTVPEVNRLLRRQIASHLHVRRTSYRPSHALAHLWR
jgi:dTMP kinase